MIIGSIRRGLIFTIFIILFNIFYLLFLEYSVRIFSPQHITPDLHESGFGLPFVLRANITERISRFHNYDFPEFLIQTNRHHMRTLKKVSPKDPNIFRILVIGSSVFMGMGVNNDEIFSHNLENLLNQSSEGMRFEVFNFSGVGITPIEFYQYLLSEGRKLSPDLVIMQKSENDFRRLYNNNISFKRIHLEENTGNPSRIILEGMNVNLGMDSFAISIWSKLRQIPFYMGLSRSSQILHLLRVKLNLEWIKNKNIVDQNQTLGHFLKTQNISVTGEKEFVLNNLKFTVDPKKSSIRSFANFYKQDLYEADANIVLYSALIYQLKNLTSRLGSETLVVDIPSNTEVMSQVKKQTYWIQSKKDVTHYFNLYPDLLNYQINHTDLPLYHFKDNHWMPAGHFVAAAAIFNFLVENHLVPHIDPEQKIDLTQNLWIKRIEQANRRVSAYFDQAPGYLFFKALAAMQNKKFESAKTHLKNYLQLLTQDYEAHYQLGIVYFSLRDFSSATQSFETALQGHRMERAKYEYAFQFSKLFEKALDHFDAGKFNGTLDLIESLEKLQGIWASETYHLKALTLFRLGKLDQAAQEGKKAIRFRRHDFKLHNLLSKIYYASKKFRRVLQTADQAIQLNPKHHEPLVLKGFASLALGHRSQAAKFLEASLILKPNPKIQKLVTQLNQPQ